MLKTKEKIIDKCFDTFKTKCMESGIYEWFLKKYLSFINRITISITFWILMDITNITIPYPSRISNGFNISFDPVQIFWNINAVLLKGIDSINMLNSSSILYKGNHIPDNNDWHMISMLDIPLTELTVNIEPNNSQIQ